MPEGDSIRRIADAMRPALEGKVLRRVVVGGTEHPALAGQAVVAIEPVGKHLLITTARGTVIRSHLGMNGRWWKHPRDKPPRHAASASLLIETDADVLTCTRAMDVELRDRRDPRYGASIARLGPDVLGETFAIDDVVARARALPADTPVASVLLDQKVACGIGNIFKCESLFAEGIAPTRAVSAMTDEALAALYQRARGLMQDSLRAGRTRRVYGRTRQPCERCRTPIASRVEGGELRRTYWCPVCQAD